MVVTPASSLALCRAVRLLAPACPTVMPTAVFSNARRPGGWTGMYADGAIAACFGAGSKLARTATDCQPASWEVEILAPARRVNGRFVGVAAPGRSPPPDYVHIYVEATRGPLSCNCPGTWPSGRPSTTTAQPELNQRRTRPLSLGWRYWGQHYGQLLLAPPVAEGGEVGDCWTAPGLDDTSWLLLLMFVSASLFVDYRSERPRVAVRPLTAVRRGLSGIGWSDEGVLGRDRGVGDEIDADRRDATRCQRV